MIEIQREEAYNGGMKAWVATIVGMGMLSGCIQQGLPAGDDLPGEDCRLVTHRLMLPKEPRSEGEVGNQGKQVVLRDSEESTLREYLVKFMQEGRASVVTYAPRTVLYGEYFSLNFHGDKVILNIGYGERRQFERKRTREDEQMLRLLKKRSDSRRLSL